MTLFSLLILILAAMLHAGWNLILKKSTNKLVVTWWGLAIGSLACAPFLFLKKPVPLNIWPFVLVSAVVEVIYYGLLAIAYDKEDFSIVYPIARGGAPALLAIWAILFLKETPTTAGKIGLFTLIGGLMIVGGSKLRESETLKIKNLAGIGLACLVAISISIYSVIDGAAVQHTDAPAYTIFVFLMTAIFSIPVIFGRYGWQRVVAEGRFHWLQATAIGILSLLAYMLVLIAYTFTPVSYAGAVREISILFGALAGWLFLKEKFGLTRLVGALVMVAGIATIILAG